MPMSITVLIAYLALIAVTALFAIMQFRFTLRLQRQNEQLQRADMMRWPAFGATQTGAANLAALAHTQQEQDAPAQPKTPEPPAEVQPYS